MKPAEVRGDIFWIGISILAAATLGFAVPALTSAILEHTLPMGMIAAIAAATFSIQLFDFLGAMARLRLQTRLSQAYRAALMKRILKLPTELFRRHSVADLITRAGLADPETERAIFSASSGLLSGLLSLSSLLAVFYLHSKLGWISLLTGFLALALSGLVFSRRLRMERKTLATASQLRSFLLQLFDGISKVRSSGSESSLFRRWKALFRTRRSLELTSSQMGSRTSALYASLPILSAAVFMRILDQGLEPMPPGRYLSLISAFAIYFAGIVRIAGALTELAAVLPALERARPLLEAAPERGCALARKIQLQGGIEFKNVSFRYAPTRPFVLDQVSFRFEPGQVIALVGPSGSGKSTLVRLLLGFETPERGEILFDGVPLRELDLQDLRGQIGTVLQHDRLITGSIYENIAATRPLTQEAAWEAARIAGFDQELSRLPMGMSTRITQGGRAFSGGERQRLMIARAVAGKPKLLLLDEATSALDNAVQAEVMRNLEALRVTRIVVAHRLSTIRNADQVIHFGRRGSSGRQRNQSSDRDPSPLVSTRNTLC